jgi:cation diffusion facilitator CzcD-associated flavoprotein CzcO
VAIAERHDLVDDALLHTRVRSSEWDEARARWIVRTDRGDVVRARYLVLATGILNLLKLPVIPGMETFTGRSFHTARWDYGYTGGGPHGQLDRLGDKTVGVLGTGASSIQCIPHLAEGAQHVYVFQRTPSAIGARDNRPTPDNFAARLQPGWQRARMDNFQAIMSGAPVAEDLTDDGWTRHYAKSRRLPRDPAWSTSEYVARLEQFDFEVMEHHRARVDEIVTDRRAAEILKPFYRYICKRPCFHDEYLDSFNRSNVTLIDCPAGIERITEHGLVVNGEAFDLDCVVYATGFEPESTPLPRRVGHRVTGRHGLTLADKWADGAASLWGMVSRGFPNLFVMPAPGQQAVVTVNHTHVTVEGSEHIAATVRLLEAGGIRSFEVGHDAEEAWRAGIESTFVDGSKMMAACTPSRINNEGHPEAFRARDGNYGGGIGDLVAFRKLLADWRAAGDFAGLDLDLNPAR